jgi:hypothetical protein
MRFGLQPNDAWFWLCPKTVAFQNATSQHRKESRWVELSAAHVPAWLSKYGGHIAGVNAVFLAQLGKP